MASKNKTNSKRKSRPKKPKIKLKKVIDERLVKALSHPMRAHVFSVLNERVASPNELAREVGLEVDYLAYHFRELKESKCIEEVRREQRRGATEHFYRATAKWFIEGKDWDRMPSSVKSSMSANIFQAIVDETKDSMEAGVFDARDEVHISWTPLLVDEKGMKDLNGALLETLERVFVIQAESADRLAQNDEQPIPVTAAMLGFETVSGVAIQEADSPAMG